MALKAIFPQWEFMQKYDNSTFIIIRSSIYALGGAATFFNKMKKKTLFLLLHFTYVQLYFTEEK